MTTTTSIDINPALVEVFGSDFFYVKPNGKPVTSLSASANEMIYYRKIIIEESAETYPLKPDLWDNWFPFAWVAFQRLSGSAQVRSFATIGTGPGVDAIGALHAFNNLETLVLTDIDEKVVPVAKRNVERYVGVVSFVALVGSLCRPLREHDIKVDLIYENLPNIPDADDVVAGYGKASRYKAGSFDLSDEQAKKYLLESHLAFLIEAKESLNQKGSVICSIGGRVPYNILRSTIESAGYQFQELVAGLKVQTEAKEVLLGYAKAEKGNIIFGFYRYDEAVRFLESTGMKRPFIELQGDKLKELLEPYRISANEALVLYQKDQSYKIGHTVHMIRAVKLV